MGEEGCVCECVFQRTDIEQAVRREEHDGEHPGQHDRKEVGHS